MPESIQPISPTPRIPRELPPREREHPKPKKKEEEKKNIPPARPGKVV